MRWVAECNAVWVDQRIGMKSFSRIDGWHCTNIHHFGDELWVRLKAVIGEELTVSHRGLMAPCGALDELDAGSPYVGNNICHARGVEFGRSFQNVAGQLQALAEVRDDLLEVLDSDDAAALNHLMRDIHPSNLNALQREADGINKSIAALRSIGDIQGLQGQATRFRDKYAELRPKLERLRKELAAKGAGQQWLELLSLVNGLVLFGGAGVVAEALAKAAQALAEMASSEVA